LGYIENNTNAASDLLLLVEERLRKTEFGTDRTVGAHDFEFGVTNLAAFTRGYLHGLLRAGQIHAIAADTKRSSGGVWPGLRIIHGGIGSEQRRKGLVDADIVTFRIVRNSDAHRKKLEQSFEFFHSPREFAVPLFEFLDSCNVVGRGLGAPARHTEASG